MKYDSSNPPSSSKARRRTRKHAPDTQSTGAGPVGAEVELVRVAPGEAVVRREEPSRAWPAASVMEGNRRADG